MLKADESLLLDFIRAVSAFIVLLAHVQQILVSPTWMPFSLSGRSDIVPFLYSQIGAIGVMVFFVISGFLIAYSIANNLKKSRYESFSAKKYFRSRLLRLYPPLIFSQVLVLLVFGVFYFFEINSAVSFTTGKELYLARNEFDFHFVDYAGSFFFLNNIVSGVSSPIINGPLWSVAQEFWFYIIAGLLVASFYQPTMLIPLVLVLGSIISEADVFFLYGFGVWLLGAAAAVVHMKKLHQSNIGLLSIVALVALFLWVALLYFNEDSYVRARHQFVFGVAFSFILLLLLANKNVLREMACSWYVRKISRQAAFSYTLYLIHFPLLLLVWAVTNRYVQGDLLLVSAVSLVSIAALMWISAKVSLFTEGASKIR
ncbi:MAG: acyltransferase family protein [Pseudomonadales bacterium]